MSIESPPCHNILECHSVVDHDADIGHGGVVFAPSLQCSLDLGAMRKNIYGIVLKLGLWRIFTFASVRLGYKEYSSSVWLSARSASHGHVSPHSTLENERKINPRKTQNFMTVPSDDVILSSLRRFSFIALLLRLWNHLSLHHTGITAKILKLLMPHTDELVVVQVIHCFFN